MRLDLVCFRHIRFSLTEKSGRISGANVTDISSHENQSAYPWWKKCVCRIVNALWDTVSHRYPNWHQSEPGLFEMSTGIDSPTLAADGLTESSKQVIMLSTSDWVNQCVYGWVSMWVDVWSRNFFRWCCTGGFCNFFAYVAIPLTNQCTGSPDHGMGTN